MKFTTLIAALAFSNLALADLVIPKQLTAEELVKEIETIVEAKIQQSFKNPQVQIEVTQQKIQHLQPIGPLMPQFRLNGDKLQMRNVFDKDINAQIQKVQKEMDQRRQMHRQKMMEKMNDAMNKMNKRQPLIGADQHDNWNKQDNAIIGGGQHDNWNTKEQQPLIGGDQHDNWNAEQGHPLVGNHDEVAWMKQSNYKVDNKQWKHQRKDGRHEKKEWKKHQGRNKKHDNQEWKNRQITSEEVMPFLTKTFPSLQGGNIVSVVNKGFDKGFNLDIVYLDKDGKQFNIDATFRPRKEQLLVLKMEQATLLLGKNEESEKKVFQERLQMVPQFIPKQKHHKPKKEYSVPPHFLEKKHAEEQAKQEMMIPPQQIDYPILGREEIMPIQQIQHPILGEQTEMINRNELILGKDQIAEKQVQQNDVEEIQIDDIEEDIENLKEDQIVLKKK